LAAIVEHGLLKELRSGRDLKKAASLRGDGGDEICTRFLRREWHVESITEKPAAEAGFSGNSIQGPEGPCSLRTLSRPALKKTLGPACRNLFENGVEALEEIPPRNAQPGRDLVDNHQFQRCLAPAFPKLVGQGDD